MALNLNNQFKEQVSIEKFFGITGVRILTNEDGVPYINPTNAEKAEIFEGFKTDKEEKEYVTDSKLSWGWTDLASKGGTKRVSQKDYDEMAPMDREDVVLEEEVPLVRVTFAVETLDNTKLRKLITFRFYKSKEITKKGDKIKMFNRFGKTSYMTADGLFSSKMFEHTDEDMAMPMPMGTGHLNFEDMLNFIYAYSTVSRKVALLEELDLESILQGDMSSISDLIMVIHDQIKTSTGKPAYGALVLFTAEANSKNKFNQSYYHVFERYFIDNDLNTNKEFDRIKGELVNERKPQKNGKTYSPESKGIFVGHDGMPKLGLKEFKTSYGDKLLSYKTQAAMPAAPVQTADSMFGTDPVEEGNFF